MKKVIMALVLAWATTTLDATDWEVQEATKSNGDLNGYSLITRSLTSGSLLVVQCFEDGECEVYISADKKFIGSSKIKSTKIHIDGSTSDHLRKFTNPQPNILYWGGNNGIWTTWLFTTSEQSVTVTYTNGKVDLFNTSLLLQTMEEDERLINNYTFMKKVYEKFNQHD